MDNENFNQNTNSEENTNTFEKTAGSENQNTSAENSKTSGKKGKFADGVKKVFSRKSVHQHFENLQSSGKSYAITVIFAVLIMLVAAFTIFFTHIRGPEKVMVPEVRGKMLRDALIEMQNKELYPKVTLRYSDVPGDENTILEQSPDAGTIVRGYSRVNLVVSRGVVVEELENYTGQNFDDVKLKIQTMFAGSSKSLIKLAMPEYKGDLSSAGTILSQTPAPGTKITEPVTLKFVVSRGPNFDNTRVPSLIGKSVEKMLTQIASSRVVYDISSHFATGDEIPGTVSNQETFTTEFIKNYSRMTVEMALPRGEYKGNIYGIFTDSIVDYPYPVDMRLDATDSEGNVTTIVSFKHTGGKITIPYAVPKGTVLTLYVTGKESKKITVN